MRSFARWIDLGNKADLGVDKAQVIAEEVVQITRLGLAGHH